MTGFELLEAAFEAVPEPNQAAVARARAAFLARIDRRPRRRRMVAIAISLACVVATAAAFALVFLPSRAAGLSSKQIIRAADGLAFPPTHGIRHVRTVLTTQGRSGRGVVDAWISATPPFARHTRSGGSETEWTSCGSLSYDRRTNSLSVNVWRTPPTVRRTLQFFSDPLFAFESAYRAHQVNYLGKTTFRGIPAYKLVTSKGGTTITLLVRQGTYAPLQTRVDTGAQVGVETYTVFETLPRTSQTEALLHLSPHHPVRVERSGAARPPRGCAAFGASALRSGPVVRVLPGFDPRNVTLRAPEALALGPEGQLYVSEYEGARVDVIREKTLSVFAGAAARLSAPAGLLVGRDGRVFVVDHHGDRVRVISPSWAIETVRGSDTAHLYDPIGIAFDPRGGLDIADEQNHRIVRIARSGVTSLIAGGGRRHGGGGYPATEAALGNPSYLVRDRAGNLYFTDFVDNRIRKVDTHGIISTVAPTARFDFPTGLALGPAGELYVSDANNNRVRRISPGGTVTTVAGNGRQGFSGDGGPATEAALNRPAGLVIDAAGNLIIADQGNNRVRRVDTRGRIETIAGRG
jgi:sugar lactone lactonase YvrE